MAVSIIYFFTVVTSSKSANYHIDYEVSTIQRNICHN
jgi:hypothetical protein